MPMPTTQDEIAVFDPRGALRFDDVPTAPRKAELRRLRLGILDNSKWNANKLLRGAAQALGEAIDFAAVNYYVKHSFSKDAAPELIDKIAAENDIVLTAIGDCGSCCSACVRDAIALEKLGIPSAAIITTEFVRETELTRQAVGMRTLEPVVIAHPVSSITSAEVEQRVRQIQEQAQQVWRGTQPPLDVRVTLQYRPTTHVGGTRPRAPHNQQETSMKITKPAAHIAAIIALALASATAAAREVKVAIQFGLAYLPIMMMQEDNLLEAEANKRGLDDVQLRILKVSGSTAVNEAILSGNVDMGVMGTPALLIMWEKTKSRLAVKGLASMSSFPMILNTTKASISSLQDFTPQDRIALPATSSPQMMVLRMAAENAFGAGQLSRMDTNVVTLPHPDAMAAMLANTEVAAHLTNVPFSAMEAQNPQVKRVLSSHDILGVKATFVQLAAPSRVVAQSPALAEAVVAAVEEAMRRIAADPARATAVYLKNEPSKLPASFYVDLLKDPENAFSPVPTGVMRYAEFLNRTGLLKEKPANWQDVYFDFMHAREGS